MKVIHVLSDMKIGGAGCWLLNYLSAADRSRFDVKVVLPLGSLLIDRVRELGFEAIPVAGMKDKSFDAAAVWHLLRIFRKEKPQIVHTHASLSARLAAGISGIKTVSTKHCIDAGKTGIKRYANAFLNNRLSDRIIAVSDAVKHNMVDNGVSEGKISVIYGGICPLVELDAAKKKSIREKWGAAEEDIIVGMVARLVEVKGHRHFIDAAEIISREIDNVKFLIAGDGPLKQELVELAKQRGLERKVIFTGFVEDVSEVFSIIDINVISSLSEALCLSLIEGMCLGKPSIGTNTGGIPELVKDGYNGYLVNPGDPVMLADRIFKLISDSGLRDTMGKRGRETAAGFTSEVMAKSIEELYESILNSPDRGR